MSLPILDNPQTAPLRPARLPSGEVEGLYVHVPFCFHKCHYCDFYSITRQNEQRMARFVDLVLAEAGQWVTAARGWGPALRPRTVFFGGGTPSLLPEPLMLRLLDGLKARIDLSGVKEWTVEVNPATATEAYCAMLRESGVDRLSFGAQSFSKSELSTLERHHDPDDVPRSIKIGHSAGIKRLSVDLIYGIPGQNLAAWDESLSAALALGTEHLSCYGLTYEPNTPIAVKKRLGLLRPVEEDVELEMLRHTRKKLAAAGLSAYEISNYAKPGHACQHNLMYWTGGNYIGLGPSAASHVRGWRWRNRPHLGEWEDAIDSKSLPAIDVEHLTPERRAGELAMLMLRLDRGISLSDFADRTGWDARTTFADPVGRLTGFGLLEVDAEGIRLTDSGLAVADAVASEFLLA